MLSLTERGADYVSSLMQARRLVLDEAVSGMRVGDQQLAASLTAFAVALTTSADGEDDATSAASWVEWLR